MNFKKAIASVCAAAIMTLPTSSFAKTLEFTMGSTSLYVSDGIIEEKTIETAPYTENDRTMVPVRIISEFFGAEVEWVEQTSQIIIKNGTDTITLTLGSNVANVNGTESVMDVAPVEINGRTMVPLRFVSENLGKDVSYVEATEQVLISDEAPVLNVNGKIYTIDDYRYIYNNLNVNYEITPAEKIDIVTNYLTESGVFSSLCENENYTFVPQDDLDSIAQYLNEQKSYIYENSLVAPAARFHTENTLALMYLSQKSEELCADADVSSIYENGYVMANHILILTQDELTGEPFDDAGKQKALKKAEDILNRLKKGEDFDKLCGEYTQDPGYQTNPEGYVFTKGEMVQEFEDAAFELKPGEISGIVETSYGYHILQKKELPPMDAGIEESLRTMLIANTFDSLYKSIMENTPHQVFLTSDEIAALLVK